MAQSFTTDDGITLFEPGTVVSQRVIANQGGFAASGVVTLIGEADEGPAFTEEEELDDNAFGPDQINDVTTKYGEGHVVDAFRAIVSAAADPAIVGAVSLVKIVKTNGSTKAEAEVARQGFGTYATLAARRAGAQGNMVKYRSETSQSEVGPTTGEWTYAPKLTGSTVFKLRNNGGSQKTITVTALETGSALATSIEDYALRLLAQGGQTENPLTGLTGITLTASIPVAGTIALTLAAGSVFATAPEIGDTLIIPLSGQYSAASNSVVAGAANANVGCYVVTNVVNTVSTATITALKLTITGANPVVASGSISAGELDILTFKPISVSNKSGQDRGAAAGQTPDWSTTSNDGTNAVVAITSTGDTWTGQPQVGDTAVYTATFAGVTAGFYVVTASTQTTMSISRLSNGSAGSTGTASAQAAGFTVLKPSIDGTGKSLEVEGDATSIAKNADGTNTTWSNSLLTSAAEQVNTTTISRGTNSDAFVAGGDIAFKVGSTKTAPTVEVSATAVTFKESAVTVFAASFDQVRTLKDLVDFVNSKDGYSASLGSNRFSSQPLSILDRGTYTIGTAAALLFQTGRIKRDATDWQTKVSQSGLATPTLTGQSGLPDDVTPDQFLEGGEKGGTSSMNVSQAFDATSNISTNFVVPCFSQDASQDTTDGETESASTYTIDAINALVKSHVIANSELKAKQNRIGFASKIASYADQKEAAGDLSYFRVAFCIQDQKLVGSDGLVHQYQPWMSCVIAAGMQSAAGYRGIVKKFANTNGVIHRAGDFNARNRSQREDALRSGILFMEPVNTGGFRWVSDQTTHTVDNNFVFNSLQAVYLADLMALTLIDRFDRAVVGKSIAEISAAAALSLLESVMFDFRRLKWIAPSDDAPKGYKNASVRIKGTTMQIGIEAKLAGLIYFVPINFDISEVSQEAVSQ